MVVVACLAIGHSRYAFVAKELHEGDGLSIVHADGLVRSHFQHADGSPHITVSAEAEAWVEETCIVSPQLADVLGKRHLSKKKAINIPSII